VAGWQDRGPLDQRVGAAVELDDHPGGATGETRPTSAGMRPPPRQLALSLLHLQLLPGSIRLPFASVLDRPPQPATLPGAHGTEG
jgi:hypothetical protein